ncbi:hypothetical protein EB796_005271 [Bugula neritina]|uniref:Uncharacterized protein n=1 Tax=Bugula neritina TaxID=10212 RepID=A0A7J7KDR4_BUGNE|nr:hypothetical protein EB796_005271 [Bugula neritina]
MYSQQLPLCVPTLTVGQMHLQLVILGHVTCDENVYMWFYLHILLYYVTSLSHSFPFLISQGLLLFHMM